MQIVPVILAGGSGTRLWPLSKPTTPKQFLRVFGKHTLLQDTLARTRGLAPGRVVIVTGEALKTETMAQVKELGLTVFSAGSGDVPPPTGPAATNEPAGVVLAEPCARNTAPAVALAAAYVRDEIGPDAVMVVLPADHHIGDAVLFVATLHAAIQAAADGSLVTLGIQPDKPETGYGYIKAATKPTPDDRLPATAIAVPVEKFVEKPNLETATKYLAEGNYFWNSGMFVWRADAVLAAFAAHMPALAALAALPWAEFQARFAEAPSISVDYGILEKAPNVKMVPARFAWSDVGTWDSVAEFWREDGKLVKPAASLGGEGVDVYSSRKVAVVGINDVLVVDTDEGLLIMKKGEGQAIGAVAKTMGAQGPVQPVTGPVPRVVNKPWGQELIWAETGRYVGKTLTIRQGHTLSLQYHREKDETVHVLRGRLRFSHGPDAEHLTDTVMHPGESFHITTGLLHRMEALEDTEVLEVSTPQLDDIVRLLDRYGR